MCLFFAFVFAFARTTGIKSGQLTTRGKQICYPKEAARDVGKSNVILEE